MKKLCTILFALLVLSGCVSNPLTGTNTLAFVNNSQLFPSTFAQYDEFLSENTIISTTDEAAMVSWVGSRLAEAAQRWLESEGYADYLKDYRWEYKLVQDSTVNAWCMPGGKIVVYSGILPVTQTETGLAVVMGHEIAHALLNHGQQRMSAEVLKQLGATGLSLGTASTSPQTQALAMTAYGAGSELFGVLPFSRKHESEADRYGLILMAIAGYNPDEAVPFWERMSAKGSAGVPEFLSTHPSDKTRIKQLQEWNVEAKEKAAAFGVFF